MTPPVSQDTMIDEQSSASEHDYDSDRSAIGAYCDEGDMDKWDMYQWEMAEG